MRGMSNGAAAWLCKKCKGSDGGPWRSWPDKTRCHRCKLAKKDCHLRDAPKTGSPTKSLRQAQSGGGGGGGGGKGSGISAAQPAASEVALQKELEATKRRMADLESKVQELGGMVVDPAPRTADDGDR